jgi:hypothetical protein
MKYKITSIDTDTTELSYKDKKFTAIKDVQLLRDFENIEHKAKINLMVDLKKDGLTTNDLIIESKKGGKTYQDYSNLNYLEEQYVMKAKLDFFDDFCKRITGMTMLELMDDIGLDETEAEKFGFDFSKLLRGTPEEETTFPSKEEEI